MSDSTLPQTGSCYVNNINQTAIKAGLKDIHFGVAYYREYMPYERLEQDIKLLKAANINNVRIGESTWSTYEKQDGIFDFSPLITVLDAMYANGINVIIGTPTYAVPAWLVQKYPEIMVTTPQGKKRYGPRQLMDITHPAFLYHADRIITKMLEAVHEHPAIIGYQLDNETKYYDTCSPNVQRGFVQHLKQYFNGDLEKMNHAFGLDYWSNRINTWEDFPDVVDTINGSLASAFKRYQRSLVTNYLKHQRDLVSPFVKPHQFITHNFDFEWRQYSFGMQPSVDHYAASQCLDIAGVDIYHPSQYEFTGHEIGYGGDWIYALKDQGYFILETEAQGFKNWTPLPNQLYLQAILHLAHGARMVNYWHWHSIHNSFETYWKGVLSHDLMPNPVYYEAARLGRDLKKLSPQLLGYNKRPYTKTCLVVSNEALSAVDSFPFEGHQFATPKVHQYNDEVRRYYDALFDSNIQVDVRDIQDDKIFEQGRYDLLVIPMLYAVCDKRLEQICEYVRQGGNILVSLRSGVCDEEVKVRTSAQPGILSQVLNCHYQLIAKPIPHPDQASQSLINPHINLNLPNDPGLTSLSSEDLSISEFQEMLSYGSKAPELTVDEQGNAISKLLPFSQACANDSQQGQTYKTSVWATYSDPAYANYAAVVFNELLANQGSACYVGCHVSSAVISKIVATIETQRQLKLRTTDSTWPCLYYRACNELGQEIGFIFNVSALPVKFVCPHDFASILNDENYKSGTQITLEPWAAKVGFIR